MKKEIVDSISNYQTVSEDNRLQFKDGKLYISIIHYKDGYIYSRELVDVTDEVMEALVKAYYKKIDAAKQATIVRQLTTQL